VSARAELEQVLKGVAVPGSTRVDAWELGTTKRFTGMAEWMRDGEPVERVVIQGPRSKEQAFEEVLSAVRRRLGRSS
jgi:hypothetical protein